MASKKLDRKHDPVSQHWVKLEKVYHGVDDRKTSYMIELQYVVKTKKQAIRILNKIDKSITGEL